MPNRQERRRERREVMRNPEKFDFSIDIEAALDLVAVLEISSDPQDVAEAAALREMLELMESETPCMTLHPQVKNS